MNLILVGENDFIGSDAVRLEGRRFRHITEVLKAGKGDCLSLGRINSKIGKGRVQKINADSVILEVTLDAPPPPPLPLTVILALPRPKMLKRIIENLTGFGVKKIYLINAWRVEKSFWQSAALDDNFIKRKVLAGLELSCDTIVPVIEKKRFFADFVRLQLPEISENSLRLTAHPGNYPACPCHVDGPVTLAIGPEGGFIKREIETFEDIGFKTVALGQRILRVETATTFLVSKLFSRI